MIMLLSKESIIRHTKTKFMECQIATNPKQQVQQVLTRTPLDKTKNPSASRSVLEHTYLQATKEQLSDQNIC